MCISCSQSSPETKYAAASIIFDYPDETSLPSVKLSVFVEAESDVRRADTLKIIDIKNNYEWESDDVIKLSSSGKKWAGCTSFVMSDKKHFTEGSYKLVYNDAAGEWDDCYFTVSYNQKLYDVTAEGVQQIIEEGKFFKNLAVYDKNDVLLYYGGRDEKLISDKAVFTEYSKAEYFRNVWTTSGDLAMCLMPPVYRNAENIDAETAENADADNNENISSNENLED